ncbi:MAG: phospho-N-acetylmuramoyl-pentapeptide-transferase [Helicobacteraceae bacterium]
MLFWLYQVLDINIFSYITFRAGFAFFLSFVLTIFLMPRFIRYATQKNATQPIYDFAPIAHKNKKNTPTMGGLVFVGCSFFAVLISANLTNAYVLIAIFVLLSFFLVGVYDDTKKIIHKANSKGLSSLAKFSLQSVLALLAAFLLYAAGFATDLYAPSLKNPLLDLGAFAVIFWALVMVASSNAVNLTDGLDGLATVPSIFTFVSLGVFVYLSGHAILSASLLLPKLAGVGETVVIATALIGGLIGFLWYNANPAEVFMGDSGSLTLGATQGLLAVLSKNEFLLIIMGSIFVAETLSVIIQVFSFKVFGRRIFLMAPLHHHFELKNWAENKIIVRFWIIALVSNLIALLTIKIR